MTSEEKNNELNNKLTELVIKLQESVAEIKEDNFLNSQHILMIRNKNDSINTDLNNNFRQHTKNTMEFVSKLKADSSENETNDYTTLIKTLLENDFKANVNDLLESLQRQKAIPNQNSKQSLNFMTILAFILSLCSFSFLIFISIKFKLFSQLF